MEDKIRVLISEEDVNRRIGEIAAQISRDYEGRQVHLICILKGEEANGSRLLRFYVCVQLWGRHRVQRCGETD